MSLQEYVASRVPNRANHGMFRGTSLGPMVGRNAILNISAVNVSLALFDNRIDNYYDNRKTIIERDTESSDDEQCKCKCHCKKHKKKRSSDKSSKKPVSEEEIAALIREFMQTKMRGNPGGM